MFKSFQKIGISVDEDILKEIVDERKEHIEKLFFRFERYMKIIAGADFLKFENLQPEDLQDLFKPDLPLNTQFTNYTMEEMISVASHLIGGNHLVKQESASVGSNSDNLSKQSPLPLLQHRAPDLDGDVNEIITQEEKDLHSIIQKSRTQLNRKISNITNRTGEKQTSNSKCFLSVFTFLA